MHIIHQGWPNGCSSDPCLRLFEPFEKLKNYMGNLRMEIRDRFEVKTYFFFKEHYEFGTKSGKSEDDLK